MLKYLSPHIPFPPPVVTDLLMNETISDLALAKVGPHTWYQTLSVLVMYLYLYCKGLSPHIWDPTLFGCSHTVALVFVFALFYMYRKHFSVAFDFELYLFRFCRIVFSSFVLCLKWSRSVHAHDIKTILFRFSRLSLIWTCVDECLLMLVHIFRPDYVLISALFWYNISMEF